MSYIWLGVILICFVPYKVRGDILTFTYYLGPIVQFVVDEIPNSSLMVHLKDDPSRSLPDTLE